MAKYIKCEAVLALIRSDDPNDERCAVTVETAKRLIRHALTAAPAADVAPVVRCKDCKHYRNHPNGLCYLHTEPKANARGYSGDAVCVEPDDFCSYGEPKEGTHADDHD